MSYCPVLDFMKFRWTLGSSETVRACWWSSITDIGEYVEILYGVIVRGAVGRVWEMEKGKSAVVLGS